MIQITPTAAQEIKRIQRSRNANNSYFRIELAEGGCLDLAYKFSLAEAPEDGDRQCKVENIKLLVKESDYNLLQDLNLDFSEDLMGGSFRFSNPAADKTCNCGQSFQADT